MDNVALISDIHGNRLALEAVLADIAARRIERVYCLGDLVGYGPDPNGVIDLIRDAGIPSLLGNYDDGVGRDKGDCGCYYPTAEAKEWGAASYSFTAAEVTPDRKAFLRDLAQEHRIDVAEVRVHLVHGSPRKINEYLLRDRDPKSFVRIAEAEADDVLAFGHTHQQWHREYGHVMFVAVGSVGRPKDGDPRAMYTVLRPASRPRGSAGARLGIDHVRIPYDVEATVRAMMAVGLPEPLSEVLRGGA
jgi:predicted phosphodiesterase